MAAQAQGAGPAVSGEADISLEDWRALSSGKTLYYYTSRGLLGREYFVPGGDRAVFIYFDGQCFDGSWSWNDGLYCFEYDARHCFRHLRRGERLFVRDLDGDEQDILEITDEVLSCEPELLSQLY